MIDVFDPGNHHGGIAGERRFNGNAQVDESLSHLRGSSSF